MAREMLSDEFRSILEPLIPNSPPKPKDGLLRVSDRAALESILFVLLTGLPWGMLPQEMNCGSGTICRRRLGDWQEAGVRQDLHAVTLDRLEAAR